jgi:hypothetical protein
MKKTITLLFALFVALAGLRAQAGDDRLKEVSNLADAKADSGWIFGGGMGLDLAGMGIINPRVGGGTSRLGLGGLGTLFANNKSTKFFWNNQVSLQISAQKQGQTAQSVSKGFQKNLDVLRLTSTYGHKFIADKWYLSVDLLAQSQLLKTYASNYLTNQSSATIKDSVVSNFASPLMVQFSPGVTYKPGDHLSFQYSPVAVRLIYVANDKIASLNIHGNEAGKNTFTGLGSELVGRYGNKFLSDRLSFNSSLRLFSNYLDGPQNIDVLFTNNLSLQIFKGISLDLLGELFYDQDVKMNIDENNNHIFGDAGDRQAPAAQMTGAFLLKYNKIF